MCGLYSLISQRVFDEVTAPRDIRDRLAGDMEDMPRHRAAPTAALEHVIKETTKRLPAAMETDDARQLPLPIQVGVGRLSGIQAVMQLSLWYTPVIGRFLANRLIK